jgi:hypothetical protein
VDAFIDEMCIVLGLDTRTPGSAQLYRSVGWMHFLEVYRSQARWFRGTGWAGWHSAALAIRAGLLQEKRPRTMGCMAWTRWMPQRSGRGHTVLSFWAQDRRPPERICFRDYIERLGGISQDASLLANRLIVGESLEEVAHLCRWTPERSWRAFNTLREAMEQYLLI